MKISSWAWACALSGCLFMGNAMGQGLRQPFSVRPAGFDYNRYLQDDAASPSDQAAPVVDAAPHAEPTPAAPAYSAPAPVMTGSGVSAGCTSCAPAASCDMGCNSCGSVSSCNSCGGCNSCGCGCGLGLDLGIELEDWCLGEPWTLMDVLFGCNKGCAEENGWAIGGHSQWGYQDNPDGAFTGNGPFLNQREWNRFNLNQQYMYLGKAASAGCGEIGFGFRADLLYGVDGNEGQSFGNVDPGKFDFLNGWDHGIYEWAMPQLYGEVAVGEDLLVKVGHFYTLVGYEVVPSNGQFFYSRQLTFWNSEPFTHTGALATYTASDKLTVNGGWVFGMDSGFYQLGSANAFLGGFTYQVSDKTSLIYSTTFGDLGWRGHGAINSMILTQQWTDKLSSVHQLDILGTDLRQANGAPADFRDPNSFTARDSTGFIHYLFYDLNNAVKAGGRFEWFKADSVSYYTLTGGVNVKATANLTVRPEVRKMWSPGNNDTYTGAGFNDQLFNQTVFGVDAILTF